LGYMIHRLDIRYPSFYRLNGGDSENGFCRAYDQQYTESGSGADIPGWVVRSRMIRNASARTGGFRVTNSRRASSPGIVLYECIADYEKIPEKIRLQTHVVWLTHSSARRVKTLGGR